LLKEVDQPLAVVMVILGSVMQALIFFLKSVRNPLLVAVVLAKLNVTIYSLRRPEVACSEKA
jgi:hypothetical protein